MQRRRKGRAVDVKVAWKRHWSHLQSCVPLQGSRPRTLSHESVGDLIVWIQPSLIRVFTAMQLVCFAVFVGGFLKEEEKEWLVGRSVGWLRKKNNLQGTKEKLWPRCCREVINKHLLFKNNLAVLQIVSSLSAFVISSVCT